ncbi:MAG: GNAT family N-acetyltransferase [Nitrospirota bacterium]
MINEIRQESRHIAFHEGEIQVKEIESEEELRQAYHLRHRVFAEKLRWVPERSDQLESDAYDAWSTSIGLFSNRQLLGMVRMTHAPFPFMLESEFSGCLVGSHRVRKALDTAEITRLAVDPTINNRGLSAKLMRTIFKGMYHWTRANNIRYTYLVVESRLLRVVQRIGWPCHAIGAPVALPPADVLSVGALLDLDEFRSDAVAKRPEMLEWLHTTEPATVENMATA